MTAQPSRRTTRREFLAESGLAAIALPALGLPGERELLPSPDFTRVKGFVAGLRPFRRGSFRLELTRERERLVVHNYGHGGAGVTLSWGCADEVVSLLKPVKPAPAKVAVLGGGVLGLTAARRLVAAGYGVSIHAAALTPDTTSDLAGAQWAPSLVSAGRNSTQRERYRRILRNAYRRFSKLASHEYGIKHVDNYTTRRRGGSLSRLPRGLLPPVRRLDRLPFKGRPQSGACYRTLLVEPPVFLPRLRDELKGLGVTIHERRFTHRDELEKLEGDVLVNCLGLGAGPLFDDSLLVPIRGQLVHLEPQDLDYLLTHRDGYIFPRRDAVLLGGTSERGVTDLTPNEATCRRILSRNRRFFATWR